METAVKPPSLGTGKQPQLAGVAGKCGVGAVIKREKGGRSQDRVGASRATFCAGDRP